MSVRYKKVLRRSKKIFVYFLVSSIFIICNIFTFIDVLASGENDKLRIVALACSFFMECLGFLYCVVQDINNSIKDVPPRFIFDNGATGIPFVDREELLEVSFRNQQREFRIIITIIPKIFVMANIMEKPHFLKNCVMNSKE